MRHFSSLYHHETLFLTLFFEVFDNNVWELWANISQLLSKRAVITSLGKEPVVNKKPEKINTVWYGFRRTFKLFGSLKVSAGFPKTVCWTSSTFFRVATCLIWLSLRDKGRIFSSKSVWIGTICLFHYCLSPQILSVKRENLKTVCQGWILSWSGSTKQTAFYSSLLFAMFFFSVWQGSLKVVTSVYPYW